MQITTDSIKDQIPYYLTQEDKGHLVKALNSFPRVDYYLDRYPHELLQGDGWTSLEVIRLEDNERKLVKGILLSNSCDIDIANKRDLPAKIIFSPIIRLSRYKELLLSTIQDGNTWALAKSEPPVLTKIEPAVARLGEVFFVQR